MRKLQLLLCALLLAAPFVSRAQLTGWSFNDSFPWIYEQDTKSWAYVGVIDGAFWAYVLDTQEYKYIAPLAGNAPASLEGKTLTFTYIDAFTEQESTYQDEFRADGTYQSTIVINGQSIVSTGSYTYTKVGPDVAYVVYQPEGEPFIIRDVLQFSSPTEAFYFALVLEGQQPKLVGNDADYGTVTVSETASN